MHDKHVATALTDGRCGCSENLNILLPRRRTLPGCGVDVLFCNFPKWGGSTLVAACGNARLASEVHLEFWLPSWWTNFDNSDAAPNFSPSTNHHTQSQWHPSAGTLRNTLSRHECKLTGAVVVPPVTS